MIFNHISKMCVIATLKCTNMHPDICMLEYNKFLCIILYLSMFLKNSETNVMKIRCCENLVTSLALSMSMFISK